MRTTYFLILTLLCTSILACGDEDDGNNAANNGPNNASNNGSNNSNNGSNNGVCGVDRFCWEGEEVPCTENTAYEAQKAILAGGKNNPTGRGEQGSVWDPCNGRMILFGGNDEQPEECDSFGEKNYLGDTWAYSLEYQNWYRVDVDTAPSPRGRQASAFDLNRKRMYIFGGRYLPSGQVSGTYQLFNELWAFDVNTDTWEQIAAGGEIPSPRTNSGMVYDPKNDRLILFGGNDSASGTAFSPLDDLYTFDLKTLTWARHNSPNGPSPRLFHTMILDSSNDQVMVYSGGGADAFFGSFFNDMYRLKLDDLSWGLVWQGQTLGPAPRINAQFVEDTERKRLILFGGHDDTALGNTNDVWAFGAATGWSVLRPGDVHNGTGCAAFCSCPDDFVTYDYDSPERRQYHTLALIEGTSTAVLFGGTGDCGYMDDTWELNLGTGAWTEVHAAEQGIACARTGRQDCVDLCF